MGFGASSSSVLKTTITISICGFVDIRRNDTRVSKGEGALRDVESLLYLPISSTLEDGSFTPSDNCTVAVMVTLPGLRARIRTEIKSVLWYSMPAGEKEIEKYIYKYISVQKFKSQRIYKAFIISTCAIKVLNKKHFHNSQYSYRQFL